MTSSVSPLWRRLRVHQIYGANTDVGKTVVSTLLCRATADISARAPQSSQKAEVRHQGAAFLKPVSTGPLVEADDRHIRRFAPGTITECLYQFKEPVSPHLAAADASRVPSDDEVVCGIHGVLSGWERDGLAHAFVETAGGVHSPGPTGTSQADLYRPLRLPIILVADHHLGGISSSISAYESLLLRGYDVESVLMFKDSYYKNSDYLLEYFGKKDIPLLALERPPARPTDESDAALRDDEAAMASYYEKASETGSGLTGLISALENKHNKRLHELSSMSSRAHRTIWYPFTQHKGLKPEDITVIDSAKGDHFQVFRAEHSVESSTSPSSSVLSPVFDGSASWWTQGLGHGNPDLSLGAAYAAGRYGHVMFALGAHEPAIHLAELLLKHTRNQRLARVFYSDNGSTGMEVAVKMALRAACDRYGWDASQEEIGVIGLKGSYHGDTIGTMDCSEPSTFNKRVEWYRGRGFWFDFPQVRMVDGKWTVGLPEEMSSSAENKLEASSYDFASLSNIFDLRGREQSALAKAYSEFISAKIDEQVKKGRKFGALIMEPIVLGAGGMLFVDPLFQHILIKTVRKNPSLIKAGARLLPKSTASWSGVPVVFDEVFTGLYRLFHFSPSVFFPSASHPDISVNAKLLTGGLLPLAVTLASDEIFRCFNSSTAKEQALLHGHSYTAHPVGCHVACLSLKTMMKMEADGAWDAFKKGWPAARSATQSVERIGKGPAQSGVPEIWSVWPKDLIADISRADGVKEAWALGTVLAIVLKDQSGGGYSSSAAQHLQRKLRHSEHSNSSIPKAAGRPVAGSGSNRPVPEAAGAEIGEGAEWSNVHFDVQSRVLGNVFYLMSSVTSRKDEVDAVCKMLRAALL